MTQKDTDRPVRSSKLPHRGKLTERGQSGGAHGPFRRKNYGDNPLHAPGLGGEEENHNPDSEYRE